MIEKTEVRSNEALSPAKKPPSERVGLKVEAVFAGEQDPFDEIEWELRTAEITSEKGEVVFRQENVEVPKSWSMMATNIVVQKYFRGAMGSPDREHSVKQLISRVADTVRKWGLKDGYFATEADANIFHRDLKFLLVNQYMAFNSPVWFNLGIEPHPQVSACFINSVEDTMDSILTLAKTEGMLFKYGSGTGTNFSSLRSSKELLNGGGTSSGPLSFMKGFDAFAGVIKSGGKTRRAAKMVILNVDHPDIVDYIQCKVREEKKAHALIDAGYDGSFTGEAYASVFFQNSNNSVRVTDEFMTAVLKDGDWYTRAVRDGSLLDKYKAKDLWRQISEAAWECGDPGLQFDTTVNNWNTSAATARINASNPCQPAWATVLTRDGIRTIGDIDVGSVIWSGKRWTKVIRKIATGVKPVYRFATRAGTFSGTDEHRVISGGERVEAQHAESIDTAQGPAPASIARDAQAIVDGLVFGDGYVKVSNDGRDHYPLLCVGENDRSYFVDQDVAEYINAKPFDRFSHRVKTTLKREDLPKTHLRSIPAVYRIGDNASMANFLRGLYSANGSVVGQRVTLKASSFTVISQTQEMLSALGIRSYYTTNKPTDVEFENGVYTSKESYDLNISTSRDDFARLIGFIQPYKQEKLSEILKTEPAARGPKTSYDVVSKQLVGDEPVWDIEVEAEEHTYWTGGLLVSNCSEYMYLDDSACNLASLNLMKFRDADGNLDVNKFCSAVGTTILAQEILVDNAKYPTEKIAQNSHKFRPLGLGYANLGALLMSRGLPYDSDAGRAYAGAVTALMHGMANWTSAKIAKFARGPFDGYAENEKPFNRVMKQHRDALKNIDADLAPYDLMQAAHDVWSEVTTKGQEYGFRNGQVTVLAPTGTIGFMMDCDTTGIEPDIALVKYKRLVGGGKLKMVNNTVPEALDRLGYTKTEKDEILKYVDEKDTIEGAPHLRSEHLPIFDCAFKPMNGSRSIHYMGHIRMMAATQPFLSGAISKTVNLPNEATVDDIQNAYLESWRLGLKAVAVYRDGCKRSQPVSTAAKSNADGTLGSGGGAGGEVAIVDPGQNKSRWAAVRHKLPDDRDSKTHRFSIAGHDGYLHVGMYEDGTPGEMFIRMSKEGSTIAGLMDSFAIAISMALQHGVSPKLLVDKFKHTKFEPSGWTDNPEIQRASSVLDYIFRWFEQKFVKQDNSITVETPTTTASATTEVAIKPKSTNGIKATWKMEADAPLCPICGSITVRNGACHKCPNCGESLGCS